MNERKPSGNGNALRDYQIGENKSGIAEVNARVANNDARYLRLFEGHDARIRQVEDAILASASGDLWNKYIKVGSVITVALGTLAGVIYSIVK